MTDINRCKFRNRQCPHRITTETMGNGSVWSFLKRMSRYGQAYPFIDTKSLGPHSFLYEMNNAGVVAKALSRKIIFGLIPTHDCDTCCVTVRAHLTTLEESQKL